MRAFENGFWFVWSLSFVSTIWSGVEQYLYGAPQRSPEDSIVFLLFSAFIVLAYKRGWKHGKEDADGQD